MKFFKLSCLFLVILASASADNSPKPASWRFHGNSVKNALRPIDWLSVSEVEAMPSIDETSFKRLEQMTLQEGAEWMNKIYHLSQAGRAFEADFAPKASEIPCYYVTADGKKMYFKLNELPRIVREEQIFDQEEVTMYIPGEPEETEAVKRAHHILVQAYMQRYYGQTSKHLHFKYEDVSSEKRNASSSEEDDNFLTYNKPRGALVVIDLGTMMTNMYKYLTLDVERTGMEIANVLIQMADMTPALHETWHVIGSNMGAHVAGAVGRQFARETGHQMWRITGLDPSRIFSNADKALRGLARGNAKFVDVIHTSAYGLGIPARCGDADFYPNGPSEGVPGVNNVVDASLRAILYFAETVVPGNERNFPAFNAISLNQYKENRGHGKRAYMGIAINHDAKGDFILQVNAKSPFGRRSVAYKRQEYRNRYQPWKMHSFDY